MEGDILKKLADQELKINAIYESVEKTRKYFLVTMWITIVVLVIPMVGMIIFLPSFMNNYIGQLQGLGI